MSAVIKFKHKDGDDDGMPPASQFTIRVVDNGYILTTEYITEEESVEVFHNLADVIESIKEVVF